MNDEVAQLCSLALERLAAGGVVVLATLVSVQGSSYRRPGARLLIEDDGTVSGHLSGGCLEGEVAARALPLFGHRRGGVIEIDTRLDDDLIFGTGSGCGGAVRVLLEVIRPDDPAAVARIEALRAIAADERGGSWTIEWEARDGDVWIERNPNAPVPPPGTSYAREAQREQFAQRFPEATRVLLAGGGFDAEPVAAAARALGWQVHVADHRLHRLNAFASCQTHAVGDLGSRGALLATQRFAAVVIMSHQFLRDADWLRALARDPPPYVGLLGPKSRAQRLFELLRQETCELGSLLRVMHSPVGLDLGSEGPREIALAIVAEIRAVLAGRHGGPLSERTRAIHDDR